MFLDMYLSPTRHSQQAIPTTPSYATSSVLCVAWVTFLDPCLCLLFLKVVCVSPQVSMLCVLAQSCLTLCNPMDYSSVGLHVTG